jgi:epoxyqueuosine reductase
MTELEILNLEATKQALVAGARALGFSQLGVANVEIPEDEQHLLRWLDAGYHGEMEYMQRHGPLRSRPHELVRGTVRVLSARMDYWPAEVADADAVLADPTLGYVSRYALGRDYHKIMRRALAWLAEDISEGIGPFGYRVCVDTAPVLEKALAATPAWAGLANTPT